MQNRRHFGIFGGVLGASLGLCGCVANITGDPGTSAPTSGLSDPSGPGGPGATPGGPGATPGACAGGQVGPERIHRLTRNEYTNTLRTLLGNDALTPVLDADRQPIATLDAVRKWFNAADSAVPAKSAWLPSRRG
jgi:hypothetical protein